MAQPEPERVRTGVAGLDAILGGGIPRGNVILLEGAIGTGKTTLGVEFAYHGAKEFGEPGVIVVFEVSPDKLARDAGARRRAFLRRDRRAGPSPRPADGLTSPWKLRRRA